MQVLMDQSDTLESLTSSVSSAMVYYILLSGADSALSANSPLYWQSHVRTLAEFA